MDFADSFSAQGAADSAAAPEARLASLDRTAVQPGIVHFGTGRRLRGAVAPLVDRVVAAGHVDFGILAVSLQGGPVFQELSASDGCFRLLECDGQRVRAETIGAILAVFHAETDHRQIVAAIADRRTSIISLTISETELACDGYAADPEAPPRDTIGQIVAGLAARRAAGVAGLTILNCDNVVGSNKRLASLIDARAVVQDVQLADWIAMNVRFPSVYCDRLIVGDSPAIASVTDVATEPFAHWVLEDRLGDERIAMEDAGVLLVADVNPFLRTRERLVDGGLLLLGCTGLLRGHATLDRAYADPAIAALLDRYIDETSASLPAVKGFDLDRYIAAFRQRIGNHALRLPLKICAQQGSVRIARSALPTMIDAMREGRHAPAAAAMVAAWMLLATGPDLVDTQAETLWQIAETAGEDWPSLVAAFCDQRAIFGTIGQNLQFRSLIEAALADVPGLGSLVADEPSI